MKRKLKVGDVVMIIPTLQIPEIPSMKNDAYNIGVITTIQPFGSINVESKVEPCEPLSTYELVWHPSSLHYIGKL